VIDAAREVFAERGPQAGMEEVAARAGVGVGTIYRRFAGKDALLEAIARQFVAELDEAADRALAAEDAGLALEKFLEYVGRFDVEKRHYARELIERVVDPEAGAATTGKLHALTDRAVAAGALASDVTGADILALLTALRAVVSASEVGDDTTWRRFLARHLQGLRS
jgi:AcrR family transcriptional regulator